MSATIRDDGTVVQHRGRAPRVEQLTPRDAADPEKVARAFNELRAEVLENAARTATPWLDFEDVVFSTGGVKVLPHDMGGRVRFAVVDWSGTAGAPNCQVTDSDADSITVTGYVAGTATIRVWLAD